jgi:disulfide oxidoreductase YuzD
MTQEKKETAIRWLHLSLKRKFKGQAIRMTWAEMELLLNATQTIEMNHIYDSYNQGYKDCKAGLPNKTQQDESNTTV